MIERLADPATRIVSLTVTEGGYSIDDVTGEFNPQTPEVAQDLEPGAVPRTVFGLITEALARRREKGMAPFTIVSCDNLQGNGALAAQGLHVVRPPARSGARRMGRADGPLSQTRWSTG